MKNAIFASLILSFSCLLSQAQSAIPKERDTEMVSSESIIEESYFNGNSISADHLILPSHSSEWAIPDSTIDTSKKKKYRVRITFMDQSKKVKGYLVEVNDSAIVLSFDKNLDYAVCCGTCNHSYPISNIKEIKLSRKGSAWAGFWYGASASFIVGAVLGAHEFPSEPISILVVAAVAVPIGSLIGVSIGSVQGTERYTIEGNKDVFLLHKEHLESLSWSVE